MIAKRKFVKRVFQPTFVWASIFAATLVACLARASEPREIAWEDLVPKDEANKLNQPPSNEPPLSHNTFGIQQSGTVVPELNGERVKLPAFVVPLDGDENALTELLLVPYFGACIHVPPPPSNQIVYFNSEKEPVDVENLDLYMPVWATGTLMTEDTDHELAQIGYRMEIEYFEEYKIKF